MADVFKAIEQLLEDYTNLCSDFEEEMMVREFVLNAIDPVIPLGEPFIFEKREPSEYYISLQVPGIGDRVDLSRAREIAQQDARACQLVLEHDHSLAATLRVYRNTLAWLRFWSVRCPSEEWRQRFKEELEEMEKGLQALRTTAKLTFQLEIAEELANI